MFSIFPVIYIFGCFVFGRFVSVVSFRSFRWFRPFRFGRFVSTFRLLGHAYWEGGNTVINYLNQNNSQTLSGEDQCKFIYLNLRSLVSKNG
jgi:hypothetical protein